MFAGAELLFALKRNVNIAQLIISRPRSSLKAACLLQHTHCRKDDFFFNSKTITTLCVTDVQRKQIIGIFQGTIIC